MDPESLEKWKQEFQNERKEQFNKTKELQKETAQRRKAMEIKIQMEAAREEKRRKEALAERRAQHIEATMRYQRGLKNFKINKEKISIEDVLNKISRPNSCRSRKSSVDEVVVYNKELARMFRDNRLNNQENNRLKKSTSYDNLTNFTHFNYNNNNNNNNNNNGIISRPSTSKTISTTTTTNYNDMLTENQKTLQEYNKEALKNFQNLIRNELKSQGQQAQQSNIFILHQPPANNNINNQNNKQNNVNYFDNANSDIVSLDDNLNNLDDSSDSLETDSLIDNENNNKKKLDSQTEINTNKKEVVVKIEEDILSDDFKNENSNTYFNLVNRNLGPNNKESSIRLGGFNNTLNNYADTSALINNIDNQQSTNNKRNHFFNENNNNNNNSKKVNDNVIDLNSEHSNAILNRLKLASTALNNAINNPINNVISNSNSTLNSTLTSATTTHETNRKIKSILKRSSSLDNSFSNMGVLNPMVNFGIKLNEVNNTNSNQRISSAGIKDSVELANSRMGSAQSNLTKTDSNSNIKKSVRFASQPAQQQHFPITSNTNYEHSNSVNNLVLNNVTNTATNIQLNNTPKPHNVNNQEQDKLNKQNSEATVTNHMYSRISSANSIRRPIVRPRNTTPTTTTTIPPKPPQPPPLQLQPETQLNNTENANNFKLNSKETLLMYDEKPPAYPSANTLLIGNVSSYALLSQKRKEYQTKKLNSDRSVNSPKATPINNLISPSSQQQLNNVNNNNNNPLDQQNTKNSNTNHVNNNNFYNNIRYNEINYREYQAARLNNDLGTNAATPTTINIMNQNATKYRLNNTEPNLFRRNSNSSTGTDDHQNMSLNNNKPIETYTLTRIPLSPKSNLKANYYFSPQMLNNTTTNNNNEKRQQQNHNELTPPTTGTSSTTTTKFFLASGSATPMATTTTAIQNGSNGQLYNIPKTNIKFAYMNSTTNNNNGIQNQISINPQLQNHFLGQRASSADNANHSLRLNTQQNFNFENKYPLYSNYQAQYINITKGLNIAPQNGNIHVDNQNNIGHNLPVGDSMALFLKAEEMAYKENTTESQIINAVKEINNNNNNNAKITKGNEPTSLSIEEQNVKNSIMRLNERLKNLKNENNQRRYNQTETNMNSNNNNTVIYDKNIRNTRPLSCHVMQGRR